MESLSSNLASSSSFLNPSKTHKFAFKPTFPLSNFSPIFISASNSRFRNPLQTHSHFPRKSPPTPISNRQSIDNSTTPFSILLKNHFQILSNPSLLRKFLQSHVYFLFTRLYFPLSCFASETTLPAEESSNKINIEAILVSIDDFFNRNPFFVAGVTFIWLVVIPLTQEYFQKYKFISAINAFVKLRDDPSCQLLDIRDKKSVKYLGSPNLKILKKGVVQIDFTEGAEEGFVKKVLERFNEPANTTICIMDNFDGNSMKVAELLVKNGFKEAYAIRGGVRGKKGWQAIQEKLLPPSVHINSRKKMKESEQLQMNGSIIQKYDENDQSVPNKSLGEDIIKQTENGYVKNNSIELNAVSKHSSKSLSPYSNYPDMKPPTSPTPSKPRN